MKIARVRLHSVSGVAGRAVGRRGAERTERSGLWLELWGADGQRGIGEASPLPGYSPDSLATCRGALEGLDLDALNAVLARCVGEFPECLERAGALMPDSVPAARFGLETALVDLGCRWRHCSPFDLMSVAPLPKLAVNALLPAQADRRTAEELMDQGYRTLKLKLDGDWRSGLELVEALASVSQLKLRVDANRALTASAAELLLPRLSRLPVEFVEEPCPPELWAKLPLERPPVALDESLQNLQPSALASRLRRCGASILVLKPMALGGWSRCLALAERARPLGVEVVVTHLFDGPIAHRATSALALVLQSGRYAAGLAPHPGLDAWPPMPLALQGAELVPGAFRGGLSAEADRVD